MIRRCCFFLALLLTCSAASQYSIDWSRCDKEMECFLLDTCITAGSTRQNIIDRYDGSDTLIDESCKLGIQKRTISEVITLYFVQVKAALQPPKISFYHGNEAIVHCQQEADGTITVTAEDPSAGLDPKPYDDYSFFNANEALCAFTAKKMGQLTIKLAPKNVKTSVQFMENGQSDPTKPAFKTIIPELYAYTNYRRRCDPDWIRHEEPKEYSVQPLIHKHLMSFDCKHHKSEKGLSYNYQMYVQKLDDDSSTPEIWPELKCESEDGEYYYTDGIRGVDDEGKQVLKNKFKDAFIAFCGVDINKLCDDPKATGPDAPTFNPASDSANPKLTCSGGKWLINDKYYTNIEAECQARKTEAEKEIEKKFLLRLDDSDEKEWTNQDKCFEKYDCLRYSRLDIAILCDENSADDSQCVNVSKEAIQCGHGVDVLKVRHELTVRNTTQKFKCDENTGLFVSVDGHTTVPKETIPIGARIFCLGEHDKPITIGGMSENMFMGLVGGGASLLVVIAIVTIACISICCTQSAHLNATVVNQRDYWNRCKIEKQLSEAKNVFKLGSAADPEASILDGLKLVETILASETEDPKLWVLIETFLYRLHLTALTHDVEVGELLNRYFYVQAKKIIDKHGWRSPKRITAKQPEGVIRAHAIRLLALARRTDVNAQKMVLEGFKQLRWSSEEQYPHCGVLWSVIAQQRVGDVTLPLEFLKNLSDDLEDDKDLPLEDRITEFGSIKEQIYYALYAADVALITRTGSNYKDLILQYVNRRANRVDIHQENVEAGKIPNDAASQQKLSLLKQESIGLQRAILEGRLRSAACNAQLVFNGDVICPDDKTTDSELLEHILTTLIFRRMFREAKRVESQYNQEVAKYATKIAKKEWYPIRYEDPEDRKLSQEQKEAKMAKKEAREAEVHDALDKARLAGIQQPKNLTAKAKAAYDIYVVAFKQEAEDIHTWLEDKVNQAEAGVVPDNNNKTQPNTQPSSKSLVAANSTQSTASAAQKKAAKEAEIEVDFVDEFVDSFYKEQPKRITTCQLTAAEQAKYRALLPVLMNEKKAYQSRYRMRPELLVEILNKALDIFETEPVFIEDVPAGITVVGDTHGQLYDLVRVFKANAKNGKPGYETARYLFTGDYVDRGPQILEVVMTLFILKILYPDRFILLRGNHEFISQNSHCMTMNETELRFNASTADLVYRKLNETLAYMPICAIIGGEIFCAHGGISGAIMTKQELRILRNPIYQEVEDLMVADILWSDPHRNVDGFAWNSKRGAGIFYGEEHTKNALERIECTALIRAHEVMKNGYAIVWESCCLSIFGATAVDNKMNAAAFVRVSEDLRYEIVKLPHDPIRERVAVRIFGKKLVEELSRMDDVVGGAPKPMGCAIGTGEVNDGDDEDF